MRKAINLYEAKSQLSSLVERASWGEEFIIAKFAKPHARLVPLEKKRKARRFGGWEGRVKVSKDFDADLPAEVMLSFYSK